MSQKSFISLLILVIAIVVIGQSIRIVPAGHSGVIFNLKGGVQNNSLKEGLHLLIPGLQSLIVFDTRVKTLNFSDINDEAERIGGSIVSKTKDGQIVKLEISVLAQMIKDEAPQVYQKLRTDYVPVLKAKTGKVMQEVIAGHVADALYTESTRKIVEAEAMQSLSESFRESGFMLHDVYLRRIRFSEEYINAIERKQIALQKAQLAQIRKAIALKEKTISIIQGEAKAKQVEIKGKAIQANKMLAELEFLETIEQNPEKIPVIKGLKGNTLFNLDKTINSTIR